jgi:3-oxoacyl-[acyl-carrier protein] reductase
MEYRHGTQISRSTPPDNPRVGCPERVERGRRLHFRQCGRNSRADAAAVGAINAAIEALAKSFAERGIEDGVQVDSVSPGAIMTGRRLSMLEKAAASRKIPLEEAKQQFLKRAGIRRFGEAEEIADVMAFIVSPTARWMTGTVLRMDGGEVKSV